MRYLYRNSCSNCQVLSEQCRLTRKFHKITKALDPFHINNPPSPVLSYRIHSMVHSSKLGRFASYSIMSIQSTSRGLLLMTMFVLMLTLLVVPAVVVDMFYRLVVLLAVYGLHTIASHQHTRNNQNKLLLHRQRLLSNTDVNKNNLNSSRYITTSLILFSAHVCTITSSSYEYK